MNKLIHKGYFCEIFRQLRVPALVSAGVMLIFYLASFLINNAIYTAADVVNIPSAYNMASTPMYYTYIMGLVFTFIAYGWLNKRSHSDFYHALPISRTSMYFTTTAAILAWMFLTLIGTGVIKCAANLLFDRPFNYLLFLCVMVNILIAAIAVVGAVSLACAFSGTRFVNFVAAAVILFMPRVLLTIFAALVSAECISVSGIEVGRICWLFDPSYNIAGTSLYMPATSFYGAKICYTNVVAMIYNLVYAALLVLAGWRVFLKRRSEAAGMPTDNKVFQTVIRCAVGMPLLFIVASLFTNGSTPDATGVFLLVLFSFVLYCLYELISTKSMKKVVKAMPLFLICLGVCVLYIVLPKAVARTQMDIKLEASDIKGYYIESESGSDDALYDLAESLVGSLAGETFREINGAKVEICDERSREIVAEAFAQTNYDYAGGSARIRIDRERGADIVRTLSFTADQWRELNEIWRNNETRNKAMTQFPNGHNYCSAEGISREAAGKLAKELEQELNELTDEQRYMVFASYVSRYYYDSDLVESWFSDELDTYAVLNIVGCKGVENYNESFRISSLTPKTADLYIKLLNEQNYEKGSEKLDYLASTALSNNASTYFYIEGRNIGGQSFYLTNYRWQQENKELYRELLHILMRGERAQEAEGSTIINCTDGGYGSNYRFAIQLSEADTARAAELIELLFADEDYIDEFTEFWEDGDIYD